MRNWSYENPKFECDDINGDMLIYSPWSGHRNFIYDFINYYQPINVVELGSYYGCSSFAILQSIKDHQLNTNFYGVDTWTGDDFTANDYKQNVYEAYKEINDSCFEKQNSHMLRMTFDEAVHQFEDGTIDILHIDGSHHYEDAKHDYQTWKNKVSKNGIVLFHDISEDLMFGEVMGSHFFWEEIKKEHPYTCEFDYSFGLGILFFSEEAYIDFKQQVDMQKYQRINNELSVNYKDIIRKQYFEIHDQKSWITSLQNDKGCLDKENQSLIEQIDKVSHDYEKTIEEKDKYIKELQHAIENWKQGVENVKHDYEETIKEKDQYIKELQHTIENWKQEVENVKHDYEETIKEKDQYISSFEQEIENVKRDYEKTIKEKDQYISSLEQ